MSKSDLKKISEATNDSIREAETLRQRAIVKDQVYPLLLAESLSIEDAKQMVYSTSIAIKTAFNNQMLMQDVRDLEIKTKVADKPENERFKKLIEIFEDESVANATQLLEGVQNAIESFQREESFKRKLDTLKADLL